MIRYEKKFKEEMMKMMLPNAVSVARLSKGDRCITSRCF